MIKENFESGFEAWNKWFDEGYYNSETSITIFYSVRKTVEDLVWHIQPNHSKRVCDVDSEFGSFGIALRLALLMLKKEFEY